VWFPRAIPSESGCTGCVRAGFRPEREEPSLGAARGASRAGHDAGRVGSAPVRPRYSKDPQRGAFRKVRSAESLERSAATDTAPIGKAGVGFAGSLGETGGLGLSYLLVTVCHRRAALARCTLRVCRRSEREPTVERRRAQAVSSYCLRRSANAPTVSATSAMPTSQRTACAASSGSRGTTSCTPFHASGCWLARKQRT